VIELVHILRTIVLTACGTPHLRRCSIKFGELKRLVFDTLWREERIAIYETAWELEEEVKKLADLGVVEYERGEVTITDPGEFLRKTAPFEIVTRNMTAGNAYLKHVMRQIERRTREYVEKDLQLA